MCDPRNWSKGANIAANGHFIFRPWGPLANIFYQKCTPSVPQCTPESRLWFESGSAFYQTLPDTCPTHLRIVGKKYKNKWPFFIKNAPFDRIRGSYFFKNWLLGQRSGKIKKISGRLPAKMPLLTEIEGPMSDNSTPKNINFGEKFWWPTKIYNFLSQAYPIGLQNRLWDKGYPKGWGIKISISLWIVWQIPILRSIILNFQLLTPTPSF